MVRLHYKREMPPVAIMTAPRAERNPDVRLPEFIFQTSIFRDLHPHEAKECNVRPISSLQSLYLRHLSSPRHLRVLYQYVHKARPRRILQIGIQDGTTAQRMLGLLLNKRGADPIKFTGIDLFESRPQGEQGMSLKEAHAQLRAEGIETRLLPGNPVQVLTRFANELRGTDLVLVSAPLEQATRDGAWHFLPRMLHKDSQVWVETSRGGKCNFEILNPADLRVSPTSTRRKSA